MNKYILITILIVLPLFITACTSKNSNQGNYIAFFYPNVEDLNVWVESEPLNTIEECRDWVDAEADVYAYNLKEKKNERYDYNFDYECGYKCRVDTVFDGKNVITCEKTEE